MEDEFMKSVEQYERDHPRACSESASGNYICVPLEMRGMQLAGLLDPNSAKITTAAIEPETRFLLLVLAIWPQPLRYLSRTKNP